MKRVAWVMVNHDGGEEVLLSARSLNDDLKQDDLIIIVDNGSTDGSGEKVKNEMEEVLYLSNEQNLPFAAANNRGIKAALKLGYKYIGIINPDVRIHSGMTAALVDRLQTCRSSSVGAVSPVMLYEDPPDTIWFAGGKIWWLFAWVSHRGQNKPLNSSRHYDGETSYLTGCCWLARASVWRKVGPMNDRYGMYAEDVDWSWRARMKGYKLEIVNSALLVHRLSQSTGGGRNPVKIKYRTLATRLFFKHFTPVKQRGVQGVFKFIPILLYSSMLFVKGEWKSFGAYISAHVIPLGERIKWPPTK
jgi:hypothetical protein